MTRSSSRSGRSPLQMLTPLSRPGSQVPDTRPSRRRCQNQCRKPCPTRPMKIQLKPPLSMSKECSVQMPRFRLPSVYREAWELSEVRSSQRCRFTHTHIHTRTHTHKHTRSLVRTHMFCWRPSRVRPYPPTALLAFHVPCVRPVTTNPRAALRALCSRPAPQTARLDTACVPLGLRAACNDQPPSRAACALLATSPPNRTARHGLCSARLACGL